MLRMLGKNIEVPAVKPGQLRKWFAPGEQFIIVLSLDDDTGRCMIKNMTRGHSESFKIDFVKNVSILVADVETKE